MFTHVTACTFALPPNFVARLTEGFNHFVTSIVAPVASGWSRLPGGACTHWNSAAFARRTPEAVIVESGSYCFGHTGAGYSLVSKQADEKWKLLTEGTGILQFLFTKGANAWSFDTSGGNPHMKDRYIMTPMTGFWQSAKAVGPIMAPSWIGAAIMQCVKIPAPGRPVTVLTPDAKDRFAMLLNQRWRHADPFDP